MREGSVAVCRCVYILGTFCWKTRERHKLSLGLSIFRDVVCTWIGYD